MQRSVKYYPIPTEELWGSGNQKGFMVSLVFKLVLIAFSFSSPDISLVFPLLGETHKGVPTSKPYSYFLINHRSLSPGLSSPLGNCHYPYCSWMSCSFQYARVGIWTPHLVPSLLEMKYETPAMAYKPKGAEHMLENKTSLVWLALEHKDKGRS